jgi:hypothetical protein
MHAKAGKDLILALGGLDEFDNTYINYVEVGHTGMTTASWWLKPREYLVGGRLVNAGRNCIAVRLFDPCNEGGIVGNGSIRRQTVRIPPRARNLHTQDPRAGS